MGPRPGAVRPGCAAAYLTHRQRLEAEILPLLPLEWVDLVTPVGTSAPWGPFEEQLTAALAGLVRSGP